MYRTAKFVIAIGLILTLLLSSVSVTVATDDYDPSNCMYIMYRQK